MLKLEEIRKIAEKGTFQVGWSDCGQHGFRVLTECGPSYAGIMVL